MDPQLARAALGPASDPTTWRRLAARRPVPAQVLAVRALAHASTGAVPDLPAVLYDDYDRTGERRSFEEPYFARRRRLTGLALAALLDPAADLTALSATIDAVVAEPQWALPAHVGGTGTPRGEVVDLFAAETGSALAEIAALLEDRLPTATVRAAREAVVGRVVESYERHRLGWEDAPTNWAAVCAGSVALAALATCEHDRVLALAPRLRATLRRSLDGYGADGVCVEGYGYWRYGFGYYLVATQALDDALGPDPAGEPVRAASAARWQQRAFLSGSVVVPFADTWVTDALDEGLLAMAAHRYGGLARPDPRAVGADVVDDCGRWALALRSLAWTSAGSEVFEEADGVVPLWFPDAAWLVVPDGARSPIGFAARGGHNGEPHNHCDLGSFAVAAAGELLVGDAGRGVYDREYFGPERYANPAAGSQGHPVPLVDDVHQGEGAGARADVLELATDDEGETLALDLTAAYPHPALRRLTRRLERRGATVVIADDVDADSPVRLTSRVVALAAPEVTGPGVVRVVGDRATATVRAADVEIEVAPLPAGRGGFETPAWRIDLRAATAARTRLTTTIVVEHHEEQRP